MNTEITYVIQTLKIHGFLIHPNKIKLDKWFNCSVEENGSKKRSGGVFIDTRTGMCSYKNWFTNISGSFKFKVSENITNEINKRRSMEQKQFFENAKKAAENFFNIDGNIKRSCSYLERKKVFNWGCKINEKNVFVVPMRLYNVTKDNKRTSYIRTLQYIHPSGRKQWEAGCEKKGSCHIIGEIKTPETYSKIIYVAEGYSTALTVFLAMNTPCVMAGDAGNLQAVMCNLVRYYPKARFVICADNDHGAYIKIGRNTGIEVAQSCKEQFNCEYCYPVFANKSELLPSDFNDLFQIEGIDEVRKQITNGML